MILPDGEEIMPLAFFVLTQYGLVTDRQIYGRTDGRTDTLRSLLLALAYCRAGIKQNMFISDN